MIVCSHCEKPANFSASCGARTYYSRILINKEDGQFVVVDWGHCELEDDAGEDEVFECNECYADFYSIDQAVKEVYHMDGCRATRRPESGRSAPGPSRILGELKVEAQDVINLLGKNATRDAYEDTIAESLKEQFSDLFNTIRNAEVTIV